MTLAPMVLDWEEPTAILDSLALFRQERPDVPLEVVDPCNFFALFKKHTQQP